jgi:hypothetical protein
MTAFRRSDLLEDAHGTEQLAGRARVREGRDALVRWAVLLEEVIP